MARTQLAVQRLSRLALVTFDQATWAELDSVDGNWLFNDGGTVLALFNDSGGPETVEVLVPAGVDQDLIAGPRTYNLDDGITYLSGYFPESVYSSQLLVDVSAGNIFVAAFSLR